MSCRVQRLFGGVCCWIFSLFFSGCAVLHKVQLSDIESGSKKARLVSVKVSENTVDLREISQLAQGLGREAGSKALNQAGDGLELFTVLFQWGPRTGAPVYNEFYAREVPERLLAECKTGYLSNITSIRETRSYPVVKGEIIRIDASCFQP